MVKKGVRIGPHRGYKYENSFNSKAPSKELLCLTFDNTSLFIFLDSFRDLFDILFQVFQQRVYCFHDQIEPNENANVKIGEIARLVLQ